MEKLEGIEVKIGKRTFVVPELTVWCQEQVKPIPEGEPQAQVNAMFDTMLLLLAGNYPDLTSADLKKLVATRRLAETLKAVTEAAMFGLVMTPGEAASP